VKDFDQDEKRCLWTDTTASEKYSANKTNLQHSPTAFKRGSSYCYKNTNTYTWHFLCI